eukprot:Gregarina_sp_Poly_1__1658@NODE_1423_length_4176_cov_171_726211_g946_i0_p1_GENE_NODE_1423_length_4176_cov_171_726211_g946_i0NODE_1423_length_4176_cov_171_726211_g946_i0_p1_ORF_typecomplete_len737_score64_76Ank_2/PF12796_7/7_2e02Ank_2/PF12796_7/0_00021Ank_2/PF12796_7/4e11Ank_2/PF12796_7/1_2e14DHHC/PF01529_20/1_2e03DHHC/PF01529_20/8_6e28Ank_5/PF13857_6/3_6e03Ank_5/PF13857_6/0_00049Ank_5/PF13857_6/8_8e13Ank_5/PF13857_6/6_7e08Ank_4/PF13637_6/0_00089Ank_4/PF13637_6/0_014Ank_4/PF13637_6/2_3e13Ank_3/PF1
MSERLASYAATMHLAGHQRHEQMEVAQMRSILMGASQKRDPESFRLLIQDCVARYYHDVEFLDDILILHYVVWTNEHNDLAHQLLICGCNPFAADFNGDTVVHYAVRGGNLRFLAYLYGKAGDKIFTVENAHQCNIVLTAAAEAPDDKAFDIMYLMEWMYFHGISLECQDMQGKTPLMWAAQRASLPLCHWLLSRGANLGHRDHMGRTALHMVCSSGNSEVALFLCQKGAIHLIDAESNDEPRLNTPIRICWQRGHLWLAMCLRRWKLWHSLTGQCTFLSNQYAWNALFLCIFNLILGSIIHRKLVQLNSPRSFSLGLIFYISISAVFVFWLTSVKTDPGYVKTGEDPVPEQNYRCSKSMMEDVANSARFINRIKCQASISLAKLEKQLFQTSIELVQLNKQGRPLRNYASASPFPHEIGKRIDALLRKLNRTKMDIMELSSRVAEDRRRAHSSAYVGQILSSGSPRKVCFTCHHIRPFRSYHCADCVACIRRFDHHCVWVDNCVGLRNQRPFIVFLATLTIALICYFFMFASYCYDSALLGPDERGTSDYTSRNLLKLLGSMTFYLGVVNCASNVVWICFVGYLLIRTTKSMLADLTFYESLKPQPHIIKRYGNRPRGLLWELRDLTFVTAFLNIWSFCAQSDARDEITYPGSGLDLEPTPTPKRHSKMKSQGTPTPESQRLSPGLMASNPSANASPSRAQDRNLAWRWATSGPKLFSQPDLAETRPGGYQRLPQ